MAKSRNLYSVRDCTDLKNKMVLPMKIKIFLSIFEDIVNKNQNTTITKERIKKYRLLTDVFKKQSSEEKLRFLYETLKKVREHLNKTGNDDSNVNDQMDNIKQIETSCKVKQSVLGITKWKKRSFKLNIQKCKIIISNNKKQININLPFYLVRKSKQYEKTIILQTISDKVQSSKTKYYLYFESSQLFQEIYDHIFNCIVERNSSQIMKLTYQKQQNQYLYTCTNEEVIKASLLLTTKTINSYFQMKDKTLQKLQKSIDKFQNIATSFPATKISISKHKSKDQFKIQKVYNNKIQQTQASISLCSRKISQNLIQFEILQQFSTNIHVVYFKYLFKNQIYQFLTILQENVKKDEKVFIFKGIDNFINKQFVDFIHLSLKQKNGKTTLELLGIVKDQQKNKNKAAQFLLSLLQNSKPNITDQTQQKYINKYTQYWTAKEMQSIDMDDRFQLCIKQNQDQQQIQNNKLQINEISQSPSCIIHKKYIIQPCEQPLNNFLTEHPLFKEWRLYKNGGVICTDEEQINLQKKLFKIILSQIGSNLVRFKNILNISLPVIIFKKQSHLKSIARNFSYAPIFMQKVVKSNAQQRMKAASLFQISMTTLMISKNKPFNPILGQTYQGWIDGCPIFLQQTSHHPPITHYIFYGRGYKIYGYIQPKIAMGLNCIKGWSCAPNFIQFCDGAIIQFNTNKMVINGMLFGERTFDFEGLCYAFDRKNKLVAEISYGTQSNTAYKKKELTCDSVSGAIYKLNCASQQFCIQNLKKYDKQRICSYKGIWHSQIFIDGQVTFNFLNQLPHELCNTQLPLASDSCNRIDLIQLIKGNLEIAQIQKEKLQQIQRRDKKLRDQFKCVSS